MARLLFCRTLPNSSVYLSCCRDRVLSFSSSTQSKTESNTKIDIDFSDAKEAFKTKSSLELLRSYLIYTLFKYDTIVDNSFKIMKTTRRLLGGSLFSKLMKSTLYGQFAAGEDNGSIKRAIAKFRDVGVRCVMNYSAEEDESSLAGGQSGKRTKSIYDKNAKILLDSIRLTGDMSENTDGMIAIKLTGLCPTPVLACYSKAVLGGEKLFRHLADNSSLKEGTINLDSFLKGMEKIGITDSAYSLKLWQEISTDASSAEQQVLDVMEWKKQFLPQSTLYKTLSENTSCREFLPSMNEDELSEFNRALDRVDQLSQCAVDENVRILVDAEQTYYQPAIKYITVNYLMPKHNLSKPVIYNTQQCYLKATEDSILDDLHIADTAGFHYGVKIVRGAYMEQERTLAAEKGYTDPVWSTKSETNSNYHKILDMMLNRVVKTTQDAIVVASHNEETIKYAMGRMLDLGLSRCDGRVLFGQVLGIADHLALAIGAAGYMAYKYMPYGPVEEVLPYLSRRANENRGMLAGPVRERALLAKELKRRMRGGK